MGEGGGGTLSRHGAKKKRVAPLAPFPTPFVRIRAATRRTGGGTPGWTRGAWAPAPPVTRLDTGGREGASSSRAPARISRSVVSRTALATRSYTRTGTSSARVLVRRGPVAPRSEGEGHLGRVVAAPAQAVGAREAADAAPYRRRRRGAAAGRGAPDGRRRDGGDDAGHDAEDVAAELRVRRGMDTTRQRHRRLILTPPPCKGAAIALRAAAPACGGSRVIVQHVPRRGLVDDRLEDGLTERDARGPAAAPRVGVAQGVGAAREEAQEGQHGQQVEAHLDRHQVGTRLAAEAAARRGVGGRDAHRRQEAPRAAHGGRASDGESVQRRHPRLFS